MALKVHPSIHVHPGPWLMREIVEPSGTTAADLARRLGMTAEAVTDLLEGRAQLGADVARRFEKNFGVRADTLLRMQAAYDRAQR